MILQCVSAAVLTIILYLSYRYSLLLPRKRGLAILMYHKIKPESIDNLTVSVSMFERHLVYLQQKGYTPITFAQLHEFRTQKKKLPEKPVILTFDDGYEDNFTYAFPILKKYKIPATIVLTVNAIGSTNFWDGGSEKMLTKNQLLEMSENDMEFGLHSLSHESYKHMNKDEIKADIASCREKLRSLGIPFFPVFAFPYGAFPKNLDSQLSIDTALKESEIFYGLLIKSRINRIPLVNSLQLKRVKIEGRDSFFEFTVKMAKGRTKMFA